MLRFIPALTLTLALLAADRKTSVDQLVQPVIDNGDAVGIVVGLFEEGKTRLFGYGKLASDNPTRPDGETVFEIGSITKVFTGTLLAEMAQRKMVTLEDPVRRYLPAGAVPPSPEGTAEIRLVDLSTQTSGLPRMPSNFRPKDITNPYVDYTPDKLYEFLAAQTLVRKPDTRYLYSNVGVGLLGHTLELAGRKPYEELVVEMIGRPLRLADTRITLTPALRARLAPGHNAAGKPVPNWDLTGLAGAGALRSTAHDLLRFLAANIEPQGPLGEALKEAQKPRAETGAPPGRIGLGWHIEADGKTWWHNGGTGGYTSYAAFQPASKHAVVVLINTSGSVMNAIGVQLLRLLNGESVQVVPLRKH